MKKPPGGGGWSLLSFFSSDSSPDGAASSTARLILLATSFLNEKNEVLASISPGGDGSFLTERIPPGTYELAAYAYQPLTGKEALYSGFSRPTLYAAVTIKVPAEGEVKVDDLALKSSRAGK